MHWFSAPDQWLSRLAIQRGLALCYLLAFLNALNQFRPLLGENGLLPAPRYLGLTGFRVAPSLFHWRYSDRLLAVVAWTGIVLAVCEMATLPERAPLVVSMLVWLAMWALYMSIVNVGQVFYGFGWESLLLEAGFLATFLGNLDTAPPVIVLWLFRWLLFRVEFGAGLIKMRGDRCWRRLTCLDYHHETQPMPNPLSWWFHRLPRPLHRVEVLGNHVAQLGAPLLLFTPQPFAEIGAAAMALTQAWLVLSGNFAWLNLVTIVLAFSAIGDSWLHRVLPLSPPAHLGAPGPAWFVAVVLLMAALIVFLSWWPARNMVSRGQSMNASFNPLHLVNTYGAFGSVTKVRHEVVIEGTASPLPAGGAEWREYEFKGKPGDPGRRPPQVAPYHLRLDWLMWFAALSPGYARSWMLPLLQRLLDGDRATLKLLRRNPFPDEPPRHVRALLYRYRFTTWRERRQSGTWWSRQLVGEYVSAELSSLSRDRSRR
ncbi:MAG TPA: lipase maturation factor family protein [Candidatus Dormibacteraeota bacterium]|nr:lipase maturation factor family protein [Candidatus Dormibacteraeota bacterium]